MTFMLRTQCLTYDIEKLQTWHDAVCLIILWIGQGQKCRIRYIEKVAGGLNHMAALILPGHALIISFYDVRWDATLWTNNDTMVRVKKTNQNVQRLLKFAKILRFIIQSKPIIPFNMALGFAKYRFYLFSDASGVIGLGG